MHLKDSYHPDDTYSIKGTKVKANASRSGTFSYVWFDEGTYDHPLMGRAPSRRPKATATSLLSGA